MQSEVSKTIKRGLFIVFEGLDRSGKSTQSVKLAKYIKEELELPVKSINFPSKYHPSTFKREYFTSKCNMKIMSGNIYRS